MTLTMKFPLVLLLANALVFAAAKSCRKVTYCDSVDPDARRNVSQLISSKGYPVENHDVQTADGYILSLQHIPHGITKRSIYTAAPKEVVVLQHGLCSSAADFVLNSRTQSLGFILADAGYDVWMVNSRGNTYSRRHVNISPTEREFWKFSFDELAKYDLPAAIDYVLNKTSQKQVFYIGHSQGTTAGFAMLSESPEYNKKVKLMIAFAPVATVGYMTSAIKYLVPFASEAKLVLDLLGDGEFLPNSIIVKYLSELVCNTKLKFLCEDILFLLCGTDPSQLNMTRLEVYTSHSPAGTSTQSVIHYAQMVQSKKFQKYDYGVDENLKVYKQATPPEYNLGNITAPIALFWSRNDALADPVDVGLLEQSLKSLKASICVKDPLFNHIDFAWGIDANTLLYKDVLKLLKSYTYRP